MENTAAPTDPAVEILRCNDDDLTQIINAIQAIRDHTGISLAHAKRVTDDALAGKSTLLLPHDGAAAKTLADALTALDFDVKLRQAPRDG